MKFEEQNVVKLYRCCDDLSPDFDSQKACKMSQHVEKSLGLICFRDHFGVPKNKWLFKTRFGALQARFWRFWKGSGASLGGFCRVWEGPGTVLDGQGLFFSFLVKAYVIRTCVRACVRTYVPPPTS